MASQIREYVSISEISVRGIGVERNRSLGLFFGVTPIPIEPNETKRQRSMSFGERFIDLQCLLRRCLGLRKAIFGRHVGVDGKCTISFGQSKVSQCIGWILVDRLLEKADAL